MIRLIKMEMYRLFHTISTYVMIAVTAGIAVLMAFTLKVDLDVMETNKKEQGKEIGTESEIPAESFANGFISAGQESAEEENYGDVIVFGATYSPDDRWVGEDIEVGAFIMSELNSCLLIIFIAIFVPLFVNAEQKKGYIKNIAGQIPGREMLALSKMPAVAVQVFLLAAVFLIANLAAAAIFFRERLVFDISLSWFRALGMQYVLHVAWGCLIALLTIVTRSTAFAMTTGILLSSGIAELLANYLNRALHVILPSAERFDLSHYTLNYAVETVTIESTMRQLGGFLILALVYAAASASIAGIVYRKRDVR